MTIDTTTLDPTNITEPGVYKIPSDAYHSDPVPGGSLSHSGAKQMDCPAKYKWQKDHGQAPKAHFDLGHAAHRLVLGIGNGVAEIKANDWRTKDAKADRDAARAKGLTPLLTKDLAIVMAMADALREDPAAMAWLNPDAWQPEMALIWEDERTGIMRRALVDMLPNYQPGRRTIAADYKTVHDASPAGLNKAMRDHGHNTQADWYLDGMRTLGLVEEGAGFVFLCQEKTPPFVVTVHEPDPDAMAVARVQNNRAIDTYRRCVETGVWAGYATDVIQTWLPRWVLIEEGVLE